MTQLKYTRVSRTATPNDRGLLIPDKVPYQVTPLTTPSSGFFRRQHVENTRWFPELSENSELYHGGNTERIRDVDLEWEGKLVRNVPIFEARAALSSSQPFNMVPCTVADRKPGATGYESYSSDKWAAFVLNIRTKSLAWPTHILFVKLEGLAGVQRLWLGPLQESAGGQGFSASLFVCPSTE